MPKSKKPKEGQKEVQGFTIGYGKINVFDINILPQPRQTFNLQDELELALDISQNNLINPISIASLEKEACLEHLKRINRVWKRKYSLKDLVTYKNRYYVLIAGERRLRASKRVIENKNDEYSHNCFFRGRIRSTIYKGITSEQIILIQGSENNHLRPPSHEEADFYDKYYRELKDARGGDLTVASFARMVGRNEETIRRALRFVDLPKEIRKMVSGGDSKLPIISYSIACELARLQISAKLSDKQLLAWAIEAVVRNLDHQKFKKMVNLHLERLYSDTENLFSEPVDFTKARKRILGDNITAATYAQMGYIKRVLYLFDNNLIGKEESPYSINTVLNVLLEMARLLVYQILPHIKGLLEPKAKRLVGLVGIIKKIFKF